PDSGHFPPLVTSKMMDISVVVCTYNRAASLKITLSSLRALEAPSSLKWEILMVDNNSTDSTRDVIEEFANTSGLNVRYIFEPQQGRSFALNAGIREAKGEIVAFTDDDVTFDPQWMLSLKQALDEWGCIAAAGKIVPVWNDPVPSWFQLEGQQAVGHFDMGETPKGTNYAHGANGAFRREAFEKYGTFQTGVSVDGKLLGGYEDDEFGHRLTSRGEKIMYVPGAIVYHPVETHKLNKAYFRKWFFDIGRTMMWARIWPRETVLYSGIPRYLFRALAENILLYPFTFDEKRRFRRECLARSAAGGILEGCRMIWTKK
ncbi:MAG: glycosyltransferase, partial [Terriglobia bacterium]